MSLDITIEGIEGLRKAIQRNPRKVLDETQLFLKRGTGAYLRTITSNPWRVGGSGGGAPKNTGHLQQSHLPVQFSTWEAKIEPRAKYAPYVHGIEGFPRKRSYQLRPWLDYARDQNKGEINTLQKQLLEKIVQDLAK